jgi:hypothetical protein
MSKAQLKAIPNEEVPKKILDEYSPLEIAQNQGYILPPNYKAKKLKAPFFKRELIKPEKPVAVKNRLGELKKKKAKKGTKNWLDKLIEKWNAKTGQSK